MVSASFDTFFEDKKHSGRAEKKSLKIKKHINF